MDEITITVSEQVLQAVCHAALKQDGLAMLQPCGIIIAKLAEARKLKGNGHQHASTQAATA